MLTCYVETRKTATDLGTADLQVSKEKIQLSHISDMPLDLSVAALFKGSIHTAVHACDNKNFFYKTVLSEHGGQ